MTITGYQKTVGHAVEKKEQVPVVAVYDNSMNADMKYMYQDEPTGTYTSINEFTSHDLHGCDIQIQQNVKQTR